ncbi:MAG: serine/threonine-protein kinase, partial [Candidatus Aminicenantales bacterium]
MINTTLANRYRLDAELGRGGMGIVYRAHDTLLDRPVAVKVLSAADLGSEGRARLLREAQATARLNHPGIVAIYDAGEADQVPYIVMELVEGHSLREAGRLSLAEVLALVRQIAAALEQAHAGGIIHRDLKPENILITNRSGSAKLMDFGLAISQGAQRLTTEGTIVGTFSYLAPELIAGHDPSPQSDLYALGVMLYELLAARPPFSGATLMEVLSQHLQAPVVPPSTYNTGIPPALEALVVQLLAQQPADRPASAGAVMRALEQLS